MAFLGQDFIASEMPVAENTYDPVPAGWYTVHIANAELKDTKSGTGSFIKVRYDITGPTHQGRVVFGNLNIKNQSQAAEKIAHQQLGELMRAIGLAKLRDTDELIGANLQIKVDVRPATESYAASNDVKGYKPAGGAAPAPMPSQSADAPTKAAPPWAK